jgi:hypothetical protein
MEPWYTKVGRIILRSVLFRIAIFAVLGLFGYSQVSETEVDKTTRDSNGEVIESGAVGAQVLQFGDCLLFPDGGILGAVFTKLESVPCTDLHDGQIGGIHVLADGPYPGEDYFENEFGQKACWDDYDAFTGTQLEEPPHMVVPLFPTEEGWTEGDRDVHCLFVMADEGKLGASIQG